MNVHNILITKIFKSNNDIRLLSCGGAVNAVRYCIRYVTKIESSSSVLSMIQFFSRQLLKIQTEKRLRQQQQQHIQDGNIDENEESLKTGRRIASAMVLSTTSQMTIPMTEVALYICSIIQSHFQVISFRPFHLLKLFHSSMTKTSLKQQSWIHQNSKSGHQAGLRSMCNDQLMLSHFVHMSSLKEDQ